MRPPLPRVDKINRTICHIRFSSCLKMPATSLFTLIYLHETKAGNKTLSACETYSLAINSWTRQKSNQFFVPKHLQVLHLSPSKPLLTDALDDPSDTIRQPVKTIIVTKSSKSGQKIDSIFSAKCLYLYSFPDLQMDLLTNVV